MVSLLVILMIVALFLLILAAFEIKPPRGNFVAAGLALWLLSVILA